MSNWPKIFQTFWSHFSVVTLEKQSKNLNFQGFLPVRDPLVTTFIERDGPTSRKPLDEQSVVMPNLLKIFQNFWSHSPVFAL